MDSPFTQHFNTNYVLSDEEVPAIRDIINKGQEALEGIDQRAWEIEGLVKELQQEVKELQQELRALKKRRKEQRREVDEHKAFVSRRGTIRRLNHDVLTSIFCVLLDIAEHPKISPKHPAIVVSQVCQRWRQTALSTKLLWCHLHVRLPDYPLSLGELQAWRVKVASLVAMTEVWISRCCDGQFIFRFDERSPPWRAVLPAVAECAEFQCLMDTLCSLSPRWKHLALGFQFSELPNFPTRRLLAVPPETSPILTSVKLYRLTYGHSQQVRQQVSECLPSATSIWHTPTLRSLEIETAVMFHDIMRMPVVWSNLEHLTIGGYLPESSHISDAVQILALFKECPNLVTCHLILGLQSHATVLTDSAPIALQQLRELSLRLYGNHLPKGFARSLILPSLCEFEVSYIPACAPQDHRDSGLGEFLERFGATLLNVRLPYKAFTQPAFRQSLQDLPNVTSLNLYGCHESDGAGIRARTANIDRDILTRLTPQFDEAGTLTQLPLCPSLEVLGLSGRVAIDKNAEAAFVEFIAARRLTQNHLALKGGGKVARLRRFYVHGFFEFQAIDPNWELRRRGVDMKTFSLHSLSGSGRVVERFLVNLGEL